MNHAEAVDHATRVFESLHLTVTVLPEANEKTADLRNG